MATAKQVVLQALQAQVRHEYGQGGPAVKVEGVGFRVHGVQVQKQDRDG
jgi:hypothetical protein